MTNPAAYKITHSHGLTERVATYAEALATVRAVYQGAEIDDSDDQRTLVWVDEDAARNDDGSRACATIRPVYEAS